MSEHRALIEQARAEHRPFGMDGQTFCHGCTVGSDDGHIENDSGPYPCLTARLADALENLDSVAGAAQGAYEDLVQAAQAALNAESARAERLAALEWGEDGDECLFCYGHPDDPEDGHTSNCAMAAALGLAAGESNG